MHFETTAERDTHSWVFGANSNLPPEVAIRWVKFVDDDFHARFSAYERTYQYVILNRPARSALFSKKVTWIPRELNAQSMQEAANMLVGEHDFNAFRSVACQAESSIRHVKQIELNRFQNLVVMQIRANAFLHHMVRNIMGVLLEVGLGKKDTGWVKEVLLSLDRTKAGVTAPASGLYFMQVKYPEKFALDNDQNNLFELTNLITGKLAFLVIG